LKKITILAICFTLAILGGCQNVFTGNSGHKRGETLPEGYGAVKISFARGASRTAIPNGALDNVNFDVEFIFTNKETNEEEKPEPGKPVNNVYTIALPKGTYSLEVKVWASGSQKSKLVAEGSAEKDITIKSGETNTDPVKITLNPTDSGEGTGTLSFKLSYTSITNNTGFELGAFTLSPIFGNDDPVDVFELLKLSGQTFRMDKPCAVDVPIGYYLLSLTLVKNENETCSLAVKSEVAHIYKNMITEIDYKFNNTDFIENVVTNTLDYYEIGEEPIPGSLRFAIAKASGISARTTIRVMLPAGSVIKLKNILFIYNSGLVIEGNGIILTKSDEPWKKIDPDPYMDINRLMFIINADVTISRVHFKDSPGAILTDDNGNLTLESCIFSNNSNTYYGGAIHNNANLVLKNCTFYDNHASTGGAIYNASSGDITLTGNLFFRNSASTDDIIFNDPFSGGVTSGGYNAVDLAVSDNLLDWMFPSLDKKIDPYDTPFSPKTFRLFEDSADALNINDIKDHPHPIKDFYGNIIDNPIYAGAVQKTIDNGYYLDLDSGRGMVTVNPPSEDFIFTKETTVTLRAYPLNGNYDFKSWYVYGAYPSTDGNTLTLPMDGIDKIITVKAKFTLAPVTTLDDISGSQNNMSLRYAMSIADNDDTIRFSPKLNIIPGTSEIKLTRPLPEISKNITIEGGGITITQAYNADFFVNSMLHVNEDTNVTISRMHFKDGTLIEGSICGGAIHNKGNLTLESCIFSNNAVYSDNSGGAIYNDTNAVLDVKGCTFYKNKAPGSGGGAICNSTDSILKLTGNLFYGNENSYTPVIDNRSSNSIESNGYNIVDVDFGEYNKQCGWDAVQGDYKFDELSFSPKTFRLFPGTVVTNLILTLPDDYPEKDFYGKPINNYAAAGAVQAVIDNISGFYLDLVYDSNRAKIEYDCDQDGFVKDDITLTAKAKDGYKFSRWERLDKSNDALIYDKTITLSDVFAIDKYISMQVLFTPFVTSDKDDGKAGTLRYALINAEDEETIEFDEAVKEIMLEKPLEINNKTITIEGKGLTLSRKWDKAGEKTSLLNLISSGNTVTIRRVHFKNGFSSNGGAINSYSTFLIIESCIFSDNRASIRGGAIYFEGYSKLSVKGCTFYRNKTDTAEGGAIYVYNTNKWTPTELTGNLFYGNKADKKTWNILYNFDSVNNIITSDYNAVDLPFGTSNIDTQCGWDAGTGDTTSTVFPFTAEGSFNPINALKNIVPSGLADFPTTDFYGEDRFSGTTSCAPGAVK